MLILSVGGIILMLFFVTYSSQRHNLNSIKDKTVGNGQHGTARWATQQEIKRIYHHVPFTPELWRQAAREGKAADSKWKSHCRRASFWDLKAIGPLRHWWTRTTSM